MHIRQGIAAGLLIFSVYPALAYSEEMTLDYSWIGTKLCMSSAVSPPFAVGNAPQGTKTLKFVLTGSEGALLGGAIVPYPVSGQIPKGTVSFQSPCISGMYTWTVEARDEAGKVLTSAALTRPFY